MWHDRRIMRRELLEGDLVLLFNSRLRLFPEKLHSQWSGPFTISPVFPHCVVEVTCDSRSSKVNGQRLKHYQAGTPIASSISIPLPEHSQNGEQ